ncbi:hypothetical protein CJ030_MR2G009183 [Morella rubra]|uniref:Uncharacterized protein n=1 Tax=Morella rubra TaxID=262757 RepID=A0A6A1WLX8_9ROSI|nr:hypothetical protein CJ030_MR2G009183 [Morella rubra]
MGGGVRRRVLVGLALAMLFGIAIYFRLWTIDYSISSQDTEVLRFLSGLLKSGRRQFDLANKEAMDESAEWRLRYDKEAERTTKCVNELRKIKDSVKNEMDDAGSINQKVAQLEKENAALLERVETLKQELEDAKGSCNAHKIH